nr:MAG TPA: hypothetical protein [Bacteriophage sp.]
MNSYVNFIIYFINCFIYYVFHYIYLNLFRFKDDLFYIY